MLKKFLKNTDGNLAITGALAMMVVLAAIAAAVDMNGAHKLRSKYQDLADVAVLSAVTLRSKNASSMRAHAQKVVTSNDETGTSPSVSVVLSSDKKTLQVWLQGNYKTHLAQVIGKSTVPVKVMAESRIDMRDPTEIVLVLDTTRSMNYGGRLSALKKAANNFIETIKDLNTGNVKISVVPYGQYVNVGTDQRSKSWMSVPNDWWETFPEQCSTYRPVVGEKNCRMEPTSPTPPSPPIAPRAPTYGTCYDDGVAYQCVKDPGHPGSPGHPGYPGGEAEVCDPVYGTPVKTCYTPPPYHHKWHGCVGSRPNNENIVPEYTSSMKKIPGFIDLTCGAKVLPMTSNLNSAKSKVSSLSTFGETYTATGMIWGWRMLDNRAPFASSSSYSAGTNVRKVVVFMTDGLNTRSRSPSNTGHSQGGKLHSAQSRTQADKTTRDVCDGIKDAGYEVFSISFKVPDSSARALIEDCATKPDWYFKEDNASGLYDAFYDIALKLMTPRLTN